MTIEKYNQKLLAILGTIGVLFLTVALVAIIAITIMEHRRYNYDDIETGILSDEKIEKLQQENKREQIISYETPKLIDTLNLVYIIPVSHKTLNETEDINEVLNAFSSYENYESAENRYSNDFYGAYNNVIIYNPKDETNKKLFDHRVSFNTINTTYYDNDILLVIKASEKDTYKDGIIDLQDLKSLYLYSFSKNKIEKISMDGMDVYNYTFIDKSKDLIIAFGVDKNNDGQFNEHNEPTLIKKYDFNNGALLDIIDTKTTSELQKLLEGTLK